LRIFPLTVAAQPRTYTDVSQRVAVYLCLDIVPESHPNSKCRVGAFLLNQERQRAEGRRQKAEGRGQRAEGRRKVAR
jgi:hypothetical protein